MNLRHAAFVMLLIPCVAIQAEEKKFTVDTVHSGVSFRIRHLYGMFPGRFDGFSGTITCDTNNLATMKVHGEVDVATVSTVNTNRDAHLRSADFFLVEKFQKATFDSTEVKAGANNSLTIKGTLTLRGVSAEIVFEGKILGYGPDMKGVTRVGYHGKAIIDRSKFGIVYNSTLPSGLTALGNEVELILDIEAIEVDPRPAPSV